MIDKVKKLKFKHGIQQSICLYFIANKTLKKKRFHFQGYRYNNIQIVITTLYNYESLQKILSTQKCNITRKILNLTTNLC